jgi:hypothetical protein
MSESEIVKATAPVARAFERLGVAWHIGGSVGSSIHGVPRSTLDVDVVADLSQDHVKGLVDELSEAYYVDEDMVRDAVRRRASFNVIHLETMLKVDVFVLKHGTYDRTAFSRAQSRELEPGAVFPVASPEDTILNKLEWFRLGNEISERQWKDVVGVMRVQRERLDRGYLAKWAAALGLEDLLTRAYADAGFEPTG